MLGSSLKSWLLLSGAIASEIVGTLALRAAVDHWAWVGLVVAGYVIAFFLLGLVLRAGMGIAVAYGVWAALGVALTAVFGNVLFAEPLNLLTTLGIGLIIGGVVIVQVGAQHAARQPKFATDA